MICRRDQTRIALSYDLLYFSPVTLKAGHRHALNQTETLEDINATVPHSTPAIVYPKPKVVFMILNYNFSVYISYTTTDGTHEFLFPFIYLEILNLVRQLSFYQYSGLL